MPTPPVAELGVVRRLATRPVKQSLISAALGLIAGALTLMFYFAPSEIGPRITEWPMYFGMAILYGAPLVLGVWLLILWPLYSRIPATSVLWRPTVCIPLGAVSGILLYFALLRLVFQLPSNAWRSPGHILVGIIVGAVTCAFGCRFKHHEQSSNVA